MENKYWLLAVVFACTGAHAASNPVDMMAETAIQTEMANSLNKFNKAMADANAGMALPAIVSISVSNSGAWAEVIFKSGMVRMVTRGDLLQPGVSVHSISPSGVFVSVNKSRAALGFYSPDFENSAPPIIPASIRDVRLPASSDYEVRVPAPEAQP